ncbi:MAG: YceI family protein, partial [Bacteroidetes bacterium]|nr:YceI family protein [Bacteroidota bacterium]
KKLYIIVLAVVGCFSGKAQIYMCKDGNTKFISEAPLELIKAQSNKTGGAVDFSNKNVAFSVMINSFEGFNSELQKEHFLENYMEADKFQKATFKGKIIEDIDISKPGTYTVRAKGIFNIHGVDKEKIVKVKMTVKEKSTDIDTDFDVPLTDHNIKVPKIVNQKIAAVITVQVKATLKPQS